MNPLLSPNPHPLFDQIQPDHIEPALDILLKKAESALGTVTAPDFPATWLGISAELDVATEKLGIAWGAVGHLNAVADTPELRAAYNACLPKVTEFWTRLGADERLYAKYKAIPAEGLNTEQRQAHKNALRNFVLGGADLEGAQRERFDLGASHHRGVHKAHQRPRVGLHRAAHVEQQHEPSGQIGRAHV